jgi:hypothetical protein
VKVSRELWLQVEPMLSEALEMETGERDAWLADVDAARPEVGPLLRKLLATHARAQRNRELETGPRMAPAAWSSAHGAGERVGPFELVRPIGHGGMGEVWLARQADGRVQREVALKLPALHLLEGAWRERFRRERDILARLEHPHIARLYDAGVTDAGQPWLAMEFVGGLTLLEHANSRNLGLAGRLALFRQVLDSVAHAHRHLVVHRDLKPANILVDAQGRVKLLDFGIAKLLDAEDGTSGPATELTRLGGRMMTLRYAAPEQVAAGTITTTTDIYALGVILHELLTGLAPYRSVREGRTLTEVALLQESIAVPSGLGLPKPLARQLAGDLDAIVLKALRREPAHRYASVELFDVDIAAHLERRPVKARAGTWRYLAGRFIARRKLPIAAAAAVVATLVGGLVVAERERQVALAEKARAERHFASVRKLANTFIFDIQAELEQLAGSLPARKKLVGTAADYLDRLAAESHGEPALALEVAGAFRRLAEISGDARGAHLGDHAGARRYAGRASALLFAAQAIDPDNIDMLREHRVVALLLGRLTLEAGDRGGVRESRRAAEMAERIVTLPQATAEDRRNLGATLAELGGILAIVSDDHAGAARTLARSVDILEGLAREHPNDIPVRASLAYAYERSAIAAQTTGDPAQVPRAIAMADRSVAATESMVRDDPGKMSYAETLVKRLNNAAQVKLGAGDLEGARITANRGNAFAERLVAADPRNVGNRVNLMSSLSTSSDVALRAGQNDEAVRYARATLLAHEGLPPEIRANLIVRDQMNGAKRVLGTALCKPPGVGSKPRTEALVREARTLLQESRAFKQELVDRGIDARVAATAVRDMDAELARCDEALARAG